MNIIPFPATAVFRRGDLVIHHEMPYVVVNVLGGYADLFPGDSLSAVTAMGRVLTHVSTLIRHYVTIEPVASNDPAHYVADWDTPPRLAVVEHRPGHPAYSHGTEGWIPLTELPAHARRVAARLGVVYVEPRDELAVELLGVSA